MENSVSRLPSDASAGGAKRSFADGVPKQSLGTRKKGLLYNVNPESHLASLQYYNSNRTVTLIPKKVTLSRFPEELNVDTRSGKPNKRAVSVTLPSAFTVSAAPKN